MMGLFCCVYLLTTLRSDTSFLSEEVILMFLSFVLLREPWEIMDFAFSSI